MRDLPPEQIASAIYLEQSNYIGRDHEGESVKLIMAGFAEVVRQKGAADLRTALKDAFAVMEIIRTGTRTTGVNFALAEAQADIMAVLSGTDCDK